MDLANITDIRPAKWTSACYLVSPDYKKMEKSIKQYGILSPIVVQPNGTIIDGFHRWKIANELEMEKLPVVFQCSSIKGSSLMTLPVKQ
jgi:ParB-like chromosome segregation protein Spo0J